jgi:geranylgeranyl transferase type-1 subunit beta
MGRLDELPRKEELIHWCLNKQIGGFQGRANKIPDTCYSFWIGINSFVLFISLISKFCLSFLTKKGATLMMLGAFHLVDFNRLRSFCLSCQQKMGGFGKWPDVFPDVLHTYMSFCGLSFGGEPGIATVDPAFGFSKAAVDELKRRHLQEKK